MSSERATRGLLTVVFGVVALLPLRAAGQVTPIFKIQELSESSAGQSKAYGINNTGQIVGWTIGSGGNNHAAHWLNNVFTDLHGTVHLNLQHPFRLFNGDTSEVYSISNADQMVGAALTVIKCPEEIVIMNAMILQPAVLSDLATPVPGDALVNLGSFGHPCSAYDSVAVGISNRNHVVGWADVDEGGTVHAFLVTPVNGAWYADSPADPNQADLVNDLMVDLGTIDAGSTVSSATAVNDLGEVVGYTYVRSGRVNAQTGIAEAGYHAFRVVPLDLNSDGDGDTWFVGAAPVNDLMEDLGTLGGNNSWARDINNFGQVVGESDTAEGDTRAFLWENGEMVDLGTLGGANSSASRINDLGHIVGWAEDATGARRAFLYIDGEMHDLNTILLATANPKIRLSEARDVNDSGQIAGWGVAKNGSVEVAQAFLLTTATQAEIEEAEAIVAELNGETPVDGGDDEPVGGAGGDGDVAGVAITGTPNTLADAPTTETPGTTGVDGTPAATGLCGAGTLAALPLVMTTLLTIRTRRGATRLG